MTQYNETELLEQYDEMLDEIHGKFMGSYPASYVLKEVDHIAYRCGFADFLDMIETE